jgi:hypothetical protein
MTEQYPDVLEVLIGEVAERRDSNAVLGKAPRVLGHAELFEPSPQSSALRLTPPTDLTALRRTYPTNTPP